MKNTDDITFESWQLRVPGVLDRLLECDWCGYEIEGDELVKTLKGRMYWSCRQDAEERNPIRRRSERSIVTVY